MSPSLEALRQGCQAGDYYAPLQAFKTVINRKVQGPRKNFDEAAKLIRDGIAAALEGSCAPAASDLGEELVTVFETFSTPFSSISLKEIQQIHQLFVDATAANTAKVVDIISSHASVLEAFCHWASAASSMDSNKNNAQQQTGEPLTDAEREWLPLALAAVQHDLYRRSPSVHLSALCRAVSVICRTIGNPALTSSILSSAVSQCHESERNVFVATFVSQLLQLVESRPSSKSVILAAVKRLVFHCNAVPPPLSKLFRVCFRVIETHQGSVDGKRFAFSKIFESPLACSMLDATTRSSLSDRIQKLL